MEIDIEDFSAARIINFYPEVKFPTGNRVFVYERCLSGVPQFICNILELDGVERCLLAEHLVSIKYSDDTQWQDLKSSIMVEIDDFFAEQSSLENLPPQALNDEFFEAIADAFIRPTLYRDKGDIDIVSYHDGVLQISFTGHCAGCPYAQNTLNNLIANVYKKYVPEISEVIMKE